MTYATRPSQSAYQSIRDASHTPFWLDDPDRPLPCATLAKDINSELLVIGGGGVLGPVPNRLPR